MTAYRSAKQALAVLLAVVMVSAAVGGAALSDDRTADESDAVFVADDIFYAMCLATAISTAVAAYEAGYILSDSGTTGSSDNETRTIEASTIAEETGLAKAFYANSLQNYAQIWGFTNEHWIRQAELAASSVWEKGALYDPETILTDSGTYYNSAYMMLNATAQMNVYLDSVTARMSDWASDSVYDGKMTVEWQYGSNGFGSASDWGGSAVSAADVESGSSYDKVYIAGGTLWVFGGSATITASDGTAVALSEGKNDLGDGFAAGVYTLQDGRQYAGSEILPIVGDAAAAGVVAGVVMEADGEYKLATYDDGKVQVDGIDYDGLSITVVPNGGSSATSDITEMLTCYQSLISSIYDTLEDADSSAAAVWAIYDEEGSACAYLTTLSVPDNYEDIDLTSVQKEVMTVLALQELSQYYQSSGGDLKTSGYNVSGGSNDLYARGSIYDSAGNELYDDVIFTPYYYVNDTTLALGEQKQTQYCLAVVWADGENLSGWDFDTDEAAGVVSVYSGYTLDVSEIYYKGASVTSVDLDVKQIEYIDPQQIHTVPTPHPLRTSTNWFQIIMLVLGALSVIAAIVKQDPVMLVLGVVLILVGIVFGDTVWSWIESLSLGGLL